jgi:hypothetical protein
MLGGLAVVVVDEADGESSSPDDLDNDSLDW